MSPHAHRPPQALTHLTCLLPLLSRVPPPLACPEWSSISNVSVGTSLPSLARMPDPLMEQPHQLRGLPFTEKTPLLAKRYTTEQPAVLRKKSFVRKR